MEIVTINAHYVDGNCNNKCTLRRWKFLMHKRITTLSRV
jgi:hypothetical protein